MDDFLDKIEGFDNLTNSEKIKYVAYFFHKKNEEKGFTISEIDSFFESLHLKPPKHIRQIVYNNCSGKTPLFIKKGNGLFVVNRNLKTKLDEEFGNLIPKVKLKSDLFPVEIFDNTRGYLVRVAEQAIFCYDYAQYDASLVMIRKLVETLIIELFEKYKIPNEIKDNDGNFFMLAKLVDELLKNTTWSVGRTTRTYLPKIKKLADTSAHNRRFLAKKPDVDQYKNELRIILEDLVHLTFS